MTGRGFFLVFEGLEGVGKTTHARSLVERLHRAGVPCRAVREPGGTPAGERVRGVVLDPELAISAEAELLLLLAARAELVRSVVLPALERGEVVVADRYEMSTLAYQGIARGLGEEHVKHLNEFATGGLRPDAVVLLQAPPGEGLRRKSGEADRLERETEAFFGRVAEAYERLARETPGVIVVDSSAGQEEVQARIVQELAGRWPETFGDAAGLPDGA
ncbi:MAG: dTMP kinase [Gemmatimonadota bacterium]